MEPDYEEQEKAQKRRWIIWAIVGGLAVIGLIIGVTLGRSPKKPTVEELSQQINELSAIVNPLVAWRATTTEDIANIKNRLNLIGIPKDWEPDIRELREEIEELRNWYSNHSDPAIPKYAIVSNVSGGEGFYKIDIMVYGAGAYPILVCVYGNNLETGLFSVADSGYYLVGNYTTYTYTLEDSLGDNNETVYKLMREAIRRDFIILPIGVWEAINEIEIFVVGDITIQHVFALAGGG